MYTSVKKILSEGKLGKWLKLSDEEMECIIDSIPGENLVRNSRVHNFPREVGNGNYAQNEAVGENLRHYIDRGYICVVSGPAMDAEKHPLDVEEKSKESRISTIAGEGVPAVGPEPGIFKSQENNTSV